MNQGWLSLRFTTYLPPLPTGPGPDRGRGRQACPPKPLDLRSLGVGGWRRRTPHG